MPDESAIRVLIVDDEAHARDRLRQLLQGEPDFEIIGECTNGRQAVSTIESQHPDLVFLDVQMPRLNGFEVCRALTGQTMPLVIFVTAYDQYALQAFDVHAIDYLLKPFDRERFQQTLGHARAQIRRTRAGITDVRLAAVLAELQADKRRLDRLAFKTDGKVVFIRTEDIDWLEADGNYVRLHTRGGTHHLRETITGLEQQLPPDSFMRISRSLIVNLDRIKEVEPLFYGDAAVALHNGTKLTLSRTYRERLERLLARPR